MVKIAGWVNILAQNSRKSSNLVVRWRWYMAALAKKLFFATVFSFLACSAGWAQTTAQISGTVKDASGAVLPGVEVTATQTATGAMRTAVSNETGSYVLP